MALGSVCRTLGNVSPGQRGLCKCSRTDSVWSPCPCCPCCRRHRARPAGEGPRSAHAVPARCTAPSCRKRPHPQRPLRGSGHNTALLSSGPPCLFVVRLPSSHRLCYELPLTFLDHCWARAPAEQPSSSQPTPHRRVVPSRRADHGAPPGKAGSGLTCLRARLASCEGSSVLACEVRRFRIRRNIHCRRRRSR